MVGLPKVVGSSYSDPPPSPSPLQPPAFPAPALEPQPGWEGSGLSVRPAPCASCLSSLASHEPRAPGLAQLRSLCAVPLATRALWATEAWGTWGPPLTKGQRVTRGPTALPISPEGQDISAEGSGPSAASLGLRDKVNRTGMRLGLRPGPGQRDLGESWACPILRETGGESGHSEPKLGGPWLPTGLCRGRTYPSQQPRARHP